MAGRCDGRRRPWLRCAAALALALGTIGCDEPARGGETGAEGAPPETLQRTSPPPGTSQTGTYGFGEPATEEEIARWDIDVGPDGEGLPPGSGTVEEGAVVYEAACARCHGLTGIEGEFGPVVATEGAEAFPFGREPDLTTSIGNYWPYASTVFDYVRRAMPFDDPGSLSDDDVYAVTAWLLWRNDLIPENAVLDAQSLADVEMPAKEHFVPSEDVAPTSLP